MTLSLPPCGAEDADVADRLALAVHALEDARRLGLAEPPLIAAAWIGHRGRRILRNAHEHHLMGRGRVVCAAPPRLTFADKTLTGPRPLAEARPTGSATARGEGQQSHGEADGGETIPRVSTATDEERFRIRPRSGLPQQPFRPSVNLPRSAETRLQSGFRTTRPTGFEPVTFGFVDRRSIQLSYGRGLEAETPLRGILWGWAGAC